MTEKTPLGIEKTCINCELMIHDPFKSPCWECVNTIGAAPGWRGNRICTKIKNEKNGFLR